jgi:arylsulfatase A-like enzyme
MKYIRIDRLVVALALLLGLSDGVRAESLASIFTNAPSHAYPRLRTSIIFIRCHGLGYGDLSCYGQTNFSTPSLDRLAAGGTRFTNFRPGSPDFSEALADVMTGITSGFAPDETTVAQRLQWAGYHTGLIGEWTLGQRPWEQGFDEFAGFLADDEGRNYYADYLWRYAPHSIINPSNSVIEDYVGREMLYPNTNNKKGRYLPDLEADMMVHFTKENQPQLDNSFKPFFLLADFSAPRRTTIGTDDFTVPSDAPFGDEPWPQAAKNRAALITRLDGGIGRLLENLEKLGMTNNVAIFFSSSAATAKFVNPNLNFLKPNGDLPTNQDAYTAPAPMIVYWPGTVPAGRVSDEVWSGADFVPTALEIAHAKPVTGLDGVSILPLLKGETGTNRLDAPH